MDILGQIANPRMANIAQAIDIRQQRVKEQQDALAKVEMGRAIAKALPNLQEGSSFRWLAENDPEKFALVSKVLNIPLNDGERFNQYANDVSQLYTLAQADPNQAYAHAQQLIESRKAQGQDTSTLEKWLAGMNEDPMKAVTSLFVMHRSLNPPAEVDPYKAEALDIRREELALKREQMERGMGSQQNSPYFQPIQTAEGLYSFDARTGGVAPALTKDGKPVTPAQIDVGLQGELAGAKTGASTKAKSDVARADTEIKNAKVLETYTTAMEGLKKGLSGTNTGYIQGKLPTVTSSQQIAQGSVSAMAPVLKDLFRAAGEGTFTDYDQKLLLQMLPTRDDEEAAREAKINNINAIVMSKLGSSQKAPAKQGGVEMTDANGNRAIVYPDGSYEEL